MIKHKKGAASHTRGQSLVEFALVVLVLMLVFMGVFDFGYAAYAYNTIALAAREGARYGIICTHPVGTVSTSNSIKNRVFNTAVGLTLKDNQINVVASPNPLNSNLGPCPGGNGSQHGSLITVTVTYTYSPLTTMIVQALGVNNLSFTAQSTMVVQ